MPRKDDSAELTRIAIVQKDKCKPKKCRQVSGSSGVQTIRTHHSQHDGAGGDPDVCERVQSSRAFHGETEACLLMRIRYAPTMAVKASRAAPDASVLDLTRLVIVGARSDLQMLDVSDRRQRFHHIPQAIVVAPASVEAGTCGPRPLPVVATAPRFDLGLIPRDRGIRVYSFRSRVRCWTPKRWCESWVSRRR